MKLTATQSLRYGGKDLQPGDDFETSDRDGKILKAIRKAADACSGETAEAPVARTPAKKTQPHAIGSTYYRTRRMKAKD